MCENDEITRKNGKGVTELKKIVGNKRDCRRIDAVKHKEWRQKKIKVKPDETNNVIMIEQERF